MGPGWWGVSRGSRCEGPPAGSSPDMNCCPVVLVLRGGDSDPRPAFISQPGPYHGHRSCPCRLVWAALSVQTCPCVSTPSSMKPSPPVPLQLHGGQNRPLAHWVSVATGEAHREVVSSKGSRYPQPPGQLAKGTEQANSAPSTGASPGHSTLHSDREHCSQAPCAGPHCERTPTRGQGRRMQASDGVMICFSK